MFPVDIPRSRGTVKNDGVFYGGGKAIFGGPDDNPEQKRGSRGAQESGNGPVRLAEQAK